MKPYSPSTDDPATRAAAKRKLLQQVSAEQGRASRSVRRWCTAPLNVHRNVITTDAPDDNAGDD